jgi:DNA modification methylase
LPNIPTSKGGQTKYEPQSKTDNIANLPYGAIDKIVTSPPYAETTYEIPNKEYWAEREAELAKRLHRTKSPIRLNAENISSPEDPDNIGNLPYGEIDKIINNPSIDSVIFSPPYEASEIVPGMQTVRREGLSLTRPEAGEGYNRQNPDNIGNLKSDTYLEAMLQVYQQCYKVLKPQGLMILVTKNFIRNKQIIRLDLDTINLCEQAGFSFVHRRHRKLPSQSFWRIIYYQKYPDVPVIDKEDVLVFRKESNGKSDS